MAVKGLISRVGAAISDSVILLLLYVSVVHTIAFVFGWIAPR